MKPLVIIVGPTAVGKSALAIQLAKKINGEIVSGDSVQVYKKLDIGSAKPTVAEQQGIPHYLIDELEPDQPFTVALFKDLANSYIQKIQAHNRIPIVVGGTGLYIRALLDPFEFLESSSESIREKWTTFLRARGNQALHDALKAKDPLTANRLHPNDHVRIIRALEIYELTGHTKSSQVPSENLNYPPLDNSIIYIGLNAPRQLIYEKINERCIQMINDGLIEETDRILKMGYSHHLKPLRSIGYRHSVWFLKGKVTNSEMLRLLQRDTRHFAKRQLTWFKRDPRIRWFDITEQDMSQISALVADTCRGIQSRVE